MNFLWLAAGGIVGVSLRYLLASAINERATGGFPWGTLAVNLSGMFVAGIFAAVAERWPVPPEIRLFALIGLLGGFTTFSSFGLETFALARDGQYLYAALNVVISNLAGLALVAGGYFLARHLIGVLRGG